MELVYIFPIHEFPHRGYPALFCTILIIELFIICRWFKLMQNKMVERLKIPVIWHWWVGLDFCKSIIRYFLLGPHVLFLKTLHLRPSCMTMYQKCIFGVILYEKHCKHQQENRVGGDPKHCDRSIVFFQEKPILWKHELSIFWVWKSNLEEFRTCDLLQMEVL